MNPFEGRAALVAGTSRDRRFLRPRRVVPQPGAFAQALGFQTGSYNRTELSRERYHIGTTHGRAFQDLATTQQSGHSANVLANVGL
jgi:hypothetical protein